jgi:hypothetical protein
MGFIRPCGSVMPKFFSLGLALLSLYQLPQGGQRSTHSARVGDVQVTAIATRIASDQDIQDYGLRPRAGYSVVLVFLHVKNVARYPNCTSLQEWLHVRQGYEYPKSGGYKMKAPEMYDVLPTDESSGEFAFEIKNGTEPVSLRLVRNAIGEEFCAMSQHRDTRISGPESVSLSLVGLPTNVEHDEKVARPERFELPTFWPEQSVAPVQPPARQGPPPAVAQQKFEVEEQQSNVIPMKDGFEYSLIDYGVGRIQVRNQGTPKDFTEQVFWVKFQITNKAENLIGNTRYFPSVLAALRVTDNWGNVYSLRYPQNTDLGGDWFGVELPISGRREGSEQYKPNESSWALRLIPVEQLVAQVKELRIYLPNQFDYPKFYFKIEEPLSRQRDLLHSQGDTKPDALGVKVISEGKPPAGR